MDKIKASVILPAYNEESAIDRVLTELEVQLDEAYEIIVVDDGSKDRTAEIIRKHERVKLIQHKKNRGYGFAIKTGIRAAKGDIVAWYDSDGQHRPEDLLKVIRKMEREDLDYCVGIRGKDSYVDRRRVLGKFILHLLVTIIADVKIKDFNSGLRAFKRSVILRYLPLLPKRFGASTVTTILMQEQEYVGGEVDITVNRRVGKSSVRQVRDGMRTLLLMTNIILLFRPLQVFGTAGAVCILIGSIYGVAAAIAYGSGVPVLAALLIMFGMQLFCFGILSDQIGRVRRENYENAGEENW